MKIKTRHDDADLVRAITAYPAMRGAAPVVLARRTEPTEPGQTPARAAARSRRHRWLPRLVHQAG
jgi:hypothetical protein